MSKHSGQLTYGHWSAHKWQLQISVNVVCQWSCICEARNPVAPNPLPLPPPWPLFPWHPLNESITPSDSPELPLYSAGHPDKHRPSPLLHLLRKTLPSNIGINSGVEVIYLRKNNFGSNWSGRRSSDIDATGQPPGQVLLLMYTKSRMNGFRNCKSES